MLEICFDFSFNIQRNSVKVRQFLWGNKIHTFKNYEKTNYGGHFVREVWVDYSRICRHQYLSPAILFGKLTQKTLMPEDNLTNAGDVSINDPMATPDQKVHISSIRPLRFQIHPRL